MREELEKLSKLQEIDIKIDKAKSVKDLLPQTLANLESEVNKGRASIASLEAEMGNLEKQKRGFELENTMDNDRIKNIDDRLNNIANNKEFHAVAKESEKARKMISDREASIAALNDKINTVKADIEKAQSGISDIETQLNSKKADIDKEVSAVDEEINSYSGDRSALSEGISASLISRYNRIRTRFREAVIQVVDGHCQACNVALPPQMYIRVQKGIELITCPSCQRLLYFKSGLSS